jgi:hypothetical protein
VIANHQQNDDFHASLVEHGVKSKKPRLFKKIIRAFKSCFGHGFDSADAVCLNYSIQLVRLLTYSQPSRRDYVRSQDAATGFEGKDIYGVRCIL